MRGKFKNVIIKIENPITKLKSHENLRTKFDFSLGAPHQTVLSKYNSNEQEILDNSWWCLVVEWAGLVWMVYYISFPVIHSKQQWTFILGWPLVFLDSVYLFSWSRQFWCNTCIPLEVIPVGCSESCIHNVTQL